MSLRSEPPAFAPRPTSSPTSWGTVRGWGTVQYRLRRKPQVVDHLGVLVAIDPDWSPSIAKLIYKNLYEAPELRVLGKTLRPEDRYMEIGHAIGMVATAACQIVGERNVEAFEANPALGPSARATAKLNGFALTVVNAILGDRDQGVSDFYITRNYLGSSLRPTPNATRTEVPNRSLAAELARVEPTYLMLDVEGAESGAAQRSAPRRRARALCGDASAPDRPRAGQRDRGPA